MRREGLSPSPLTGEGEGESKPARETARVFFALWPDEVFSKQLHQASAVLHQAHGGRRMQPDTVHLTLLFIGAIARERLPELQAAASAIRAPKFDVVFDRPDCWRHNRIAFLTASQAPNGLFDLVKALEMQTEQTGIAFDRRPYTPHITLVRNADCTKTKPALEPMVWAARDFVLVESSLNSAEASYEQIARWPLL